MSTLVLSSASGILSLLDETDQQLQQHALQQLNQLVDQFWPEIAQQIPKIETLYEDEQFSNRNLAAMVASKVFYHLEELDDSLKYALGAGNLFDVNLKTEYIETLIAKCIDQYITLRKQNQEKKESEPAVDIDERLVAIVERMFERCFYDGEYKQAIGIAIESRRLDIIKRAIVNSNNTKELLQYLFELSQYVNMNREFRSQLLTTLIELYEQLPSPDYINMCQCLLFLNQHQRVATILDTLIKQSNDDTLMAYQIVFDLGENENQAFLNRVSQALPEAPVAPLDQSAAEAKVDDYATRLSNVRKILSGDFPTDLTLQFLFEHNKTDLNILKQIKDKLEQRNSVTHNATVMAHAIMHCGTTVDTFLRDNLEWLSRAQNWAKFTATASIGVIHKGHHKESLKLLEPYLPAHGASGSPYQEGGALYALGLIHASNGASQVDYLTEALKNAGNNEIVQHGAALGVGLSAMASDNQQLFDQLTNIVMQESAVAGEAAGYAMGLVLLGTGSGTAIEQMLAYAHDTQHEKIIRGLAMGIALIQYGREEEADVVIEQLLTDKDPILRYGGMYTIGLAYACTANNKAIERLLHVAVSDVSDDVRRAAVTCLGFVLANAPDQLPKVVALLSESYNPHVRYGAALAIGIACAGGQEKGRAEALNVLEPLLKDRVDFVRQGAFIGMAMVLIQHNEASEPKVAVLRKAINDTMNVKSDTMTKFGAILAAGILDAGGRNVTINVMSSTGHKKMGAIVGLAMFPQFWYWYPLVHFISLSFSPTAVIGLNKDLQIPKPFTFVSNAAPSLFSYPPPIELKKEEVKKITKHATLSVTAKAKARAKKKEDANSMDTTEETKTEEEKKDDNKMDTSEEKKEEVKPAEPTFQILSNPARVTLPQQKVVYVPPTQRYQPVKDVLAGFVMLRDTRPSEAEDLVVPNAPKVGIPGISDDEPAPPAPFEYTGQ